MVCGFYIGPCEIPVAVFLVSFTLFLFVGDPLAFNAAAVGGVVPCLGKTLYVAYFKHNGQPQNKTDSRGGQQELKVFPELDLRSYLCLDLMDDASQELD